MEDLALMFRPHSWQEVVGQPAIISVLQRQVATKKWKNTYLFAGPYGCGKTTMARILASEINSGQGSPIEIDGASNNGVDSIRNLISDAHQCSIDCDFKIYIIDEAHQLTKAAWDAALKLIEEPPETSIFIFCTTNIAKIPNTILSRVQTFNFKLVEPSIICNRLEFIMQEYSNIGYDKNALIAIANNSGGHVRDAIKMLDRCINQLEYLDLYSVESILGLTSTASIHDIIVSSIVNKSIDKSIAILNSMKSAGVSYIKVLDAIMNALMDYVLYSISGNNAAGNPNIISIFKIYNINSDICSKLLDRLIEYRCKISDETSDIILKLVIMEMCK